jgi:hypothetical protein
MSKANTRLSQTQPHAHHALSVDRLLEQPGWRLAAAELSGVPSPNPDADALTLPLVMRT